MHPSTDISVNSTRSALDYLYGLQRFGMKLGLRNIRSLLRDCGNPERQFFSIHIAGTNGKGSTSSMIAAVLQAAGHKTGLYTSPHLVRFNERIRIGGAMITDDDLVRYTKLFRPKIDSLNATFFEATTAIAFKYFADNNVRIAVVETGLGGRLDATNVLIPEISVITSISKDHTEQLGKTSRKIAFEKGGIIKRGRACLVGVENREAFHELRTISRKRRSPFLTLSGLNATRISTTSGGEQILTMRTEKGVYKNLHLPLAGDHQIRNAKLAIAALEYLGTRGVNVPVPAIYEGFRHLRRLTGIHGRFEIIRRHPMIVLDVGHNRDGIAAVVQTLGKFQFRKLILIFGVMADKEYASMIQLLSTLKPLVLAVQPSTERALSSDLIASLFRLKKCPAHSYHHLADAVRAALDVQRKDDLLLISGSHYVAGEAVQALRKELHGKRGR